MTQRPYKNRLQLSVWQLQAMDN